MAESNKMKDMPVNKLMIQMGIPMHFLQEHSDREIIKKQVRLLETVCF